MEVLSTTNPLPPDGGTNAAAPLGLSAAMSVTKSPELASEQEVSAYTSLSPILIDQFTVGISNIVTDNVYQWSIEANKLKQFLPPRDNSSMSVMPWNLALPYFTKMGKMEYILVFKPYKITDCEIRLQAVWDFARNKTQNFQQSRLNNLNELFSFDDASDVKFLSVPQYFMTNNLQTNVNQLDENSLYVNAYTPTTKLNLFVANAYQPNLSQPDSFNVQVFLIVVPTSMKVIACRRMVEGGTKTNDNPIEPTPYFMS
jgi:hypothetical protein